MNRSQFTGLRYVASQVDWQTVECPATQLSLEHQLYMLRLTHCGLKVGSVRGLIILLVKIIFRADEPFNTQPAVIRREFIKQHKSLYISTCTQNHKYPPNHQSHTLLPEMGVKSTSFQSNKPDYLSHILINNLQLNWTIYSINTTMLDTRSVDSKAVVFINPGYCRYKSNSTQPNVLFTSVF